ncbi:MAG: M20/M25/M40 family metallo-hydrolase [Promethearchaeota archaeon]
MVLEKLEPKLVWSIFENIIAAIPHISYHEEELRTRLKEFVREKSKENDLGITILQDDKGNVLFRRPASKGLESIPSLCLQAHLDMVPATDLPDGFDFLKNPIQPHIQENNEWIDAIGTNVGGDDGIGLALALALLVDPSITYKHGLLEVLATVEEEVGCIGGKELGVEQLEMQDTKYLINLDGTWTGTIGFGNAAGGGLYFIKKFKRLPKDDESYKYLHLSVSGLISGHPGSEIHLPRANAIKIISRILTYVSQEIDLEIGNWNGGSPSIIAQTSDLIIRVKNEYYSKIQKILSKVKQDILRYYQNQQEEWQFEPNMKIVWEDTQPVKIFSIEDSKTIISTLNILPHGPLEISPYSLNKLYAMYLSGRPVEVSDNVTLSSNLALIRSHANKVTITIRFQGNDSEEFERLFHILKQIGEITNWNIEYSEFRPAWNSSKNSKFVQFVKEQYENRYEAYRLDRQELGSNHINLFRFHWGMETSYFPERLPGITMASLGPDVQGTHTPRERIHIPSVELLYNILNDIFKNFKSIF